MYDILCQIHIYQLVLSHEKMNTAYRRTYIVRALREAFTHCELRSGVSAGSFKIFAYSTSCVRSLEAGDNSAGDGNEESQVRRAVSVSNCARQPLQGMVENSDGDGLEGSQMQQTEAARKQMEMTKTTVELMTKPTEITELVPKGVVLRTQPLQATDETQTRLELREEPLQSIEVNHVGLQSRTGPVQGIEIDHVGFESRAPQVQDIESNMIGHESRTESVQNAKITQVGVGSRTQHPQSVQLPVDLDKEHDLRGCPLQLVIETFVKDNFKEQLKRARKGDSHAQIILGHMISHGYGVQKNPLKGSEWIKRGYSKHKQRKELPEKKSEDEDLYFM